MCQGAASQDGSSVRCTGDPVTDRPPSGRPIGRLAIDDLAMQTIDVATAELAAARASYDIARQMGDRTPAQRMARAEAVRKVILAARFLAELTK